MHAGFGPIRTSQSAGSMVSEISADGNTYWVTGTAAPCISVFKPVWIDSGIPDSVKPPHKTYDEAVMFWRHEALHREVIKDYQSRISVFGSKIQDLECQFIRGANEISNRNPKERAGFSAGCFAKADQLEASLLQQVKEIPIRHRNHFYYTMAWSKLNKEAEMPQ
jgi:dipeptidase